MGFYQKLPEGKKHFKGPGLVVNEETRNQKVVSPNPCAVYFMVLFK